MRWSGCVSCGIGETYDARAAVRHVLGRVVADLSRHIRLQTISHVLQQQFALYSGCSASFSKVSTDVSGSRQMAQQLAGMSETQRYVWANCGALTGIFDVMLEEVTAIASMDRLQKLVRSSPRVNEVWRSCLGRLHRFHPIQVSSWCYWGPSSTYGSSSRTATRPCDRLSCFQLPTLEPYVPVYNLGVKTLGYVVSGDTAHSLVSPHVRICHGSTAYSLMHGTSSVAHSLDVQGSHCMH